MSEGPLTRRRFLTAAGAAVVAFGSGCSGDDSAPGPAPGPTATPSTGVPVDPDAQLVAAVVRDEQRLLNAYRSVSFHGELRRELADLSDHHRSHLQVLGAAPEAVAPTRPGLAATVQLRQLERIESGAVAQRRRDALAARSGDLARTLAAMAASSAQHVVVLRGRRQALPGRRRGNR